MNTDIAILVRAYDRDASYLNELIESLSGFYTVVGYDTIATLPPVEAIQHCDYFFTGGYTKGKQGGDLFYTKNGLGVLYDKYKYTLSITGDAVIALPENIPKLIQLLGDDDLIAPQWRRDCGTVMYFGLTQKLYLAFSDIIDERPQLERRFTKALKSNNIKYAISECRAGNLGMWGEVLGYRRRSNNYPP